MPAGVVSMMVHCVLVTFKSKVSDDITIVMPSSYRRDIREC